MISSLKKAVLPPMQPPPWKMYQVLSIRLLILYQIAFHIFAARKRGHAVRTRHATRNDTILESDAAAFASVERN
eukprot:IDg14369t1